MPTEVPNCGSYSTLAKINWDHFSSWEGQGGGGNWEAYSAGHSVACQEAHQYNIDKDTLTGEGQFPGLHRALLMNACASHFLSDMFAAGHLRQPRRALKGVPDSMISKLMHDEDNRLGLWVHNQMGKKWQAFGDTFYKDGRHGEGREMQRKALQASADLILGVWRGSATLEQCQADAEVKEWVPDVARVQDIRRAQEDGNHPPMVLPITGGGGGWKMRPSLCDPYGHGGMFRKTAVTFAGVLGDVLDHNRTATHVDEFVDEAFRGGLRGDGSPFNPNSYETDVPSMEVIQRVVAGCADRWPEWAAEWLGVGEEEGHGVAKFVENAIKYLGPQVLNSWGRELGLRG